jgi:hypothetical protein
MNFFLRVGAKEAQDQAPVLSNEYGDQDTFWKKCILFK